MVTGVAIIRDRWVQRTSRSPLSSASTNSTDSIGPTTSSEELNVTKERHASQSSSSTTGLGSRMLARNSSVSSQNSLEKSPASSAQRGSSPQIKTFDPDGRHHYQDFSRAASSYPPTKSRSPSPSAVFLDPRSVSPENHQTGIIFPSETGASSSGIPSIKIANRCLSPLLIPSARSSISDESPAPPASPLGSIQPDLYHRQDGPLFLSAHSPGSRSGKNMGRLHLRLSYDFDKSDLHVHLIEALDLTGSDQGGFNDPFVKLTLSPEVDSRKRQTRIYRNDRNPCFDQHFKFPVSFEELQEKTLVLQVFDFDRYSRNNVVGSVRVAMNELKLVTSTSSVEVWGEIAREKKPPEEMQEVLVSLSYLPSAERLTVLILKARNLFPLQDKETLDPFVKVSLLSGEKRVKKKKTVVKKSIRNPVWNEAMSFDIPASSLATSAIEVCVLDGSSELMGGNAIVGSCIVGPAYLGHSSETERGNPSREHWTHVTQSPRKSIAMWHTLH